MTIDEVIDRAVLKTKDLPGKWFVSRAKFLRWREDRSNPQDFCPIEAAYTPKLFVSYKDSGRRMGMHPDDILKIAYAADRSVDSIANRLYLGAIGVKGLTPEDLIEVRKKMFKAFDLDEERYEDSRSGRASQGKDTRHPWSMGSLL